ncbi:MAG: hypothetical protein HY329_08435 [Chloroflexi bacterium]|nr:hypothetical protein [Chloroflexota bacterium]
MATDPPSSAAERFHGSDPYDRVADAYYVRGWTDGLPIVPPTERRVEAMLAAGSWPRDEVLAVVPPRLGAATAEKVAINAVMAGCDSSYFRVVVAALRAACEPEFNLDGIQNTTNGVTPLVIVNGPLAAELDVNATGNALGPGRRANATIGRALRLLLLNVGGGIPGDVDRATHGQPGKYTFCFAEDEAGSPWPALHVERGFDPTQSTVTLVAATGTLNVHDVGCQTAAERLHIVAGAMRALGSSALQWQSEPLVILNAESARACADAGLSKDGVRRALWQKARVPLSEYSLGGLEFLRNHRPVWFGQDPLPDYLPVAERPEDVMLVVTGGPGRHWIFVPTFGGIRSLTRPVI